MEWVAHLLGGGAQEQRAQGGFLPSWAVSGITARASRHHFLPEQLPGHPTPASFLVKNHPSAECQLLCKFSRPFSWTVPALYTHNSSVLLRWLQIIFYLLFDSFSFTGICCRNTMFWQGRLQNSWKAQHHIASPWMLDFWEEFHAGTEPGNLVYLIHTHACSLRAQQKYWYRDSLDIILKVLFSYYFCTALDFKNIEVGLTWLG